MRFVFETQFTIEPIARDHQNGKIIKNFTKFNFFAVTSCNKENHELRPPALTFSIRDQQTARSDLVRTGLKFLWEAWDIVEVLLATNPRTWVYRDGSPAFYFKWADDEPNNTERESNVDHQMLIICTCSWFNDFEDSSA